MMPDAFPRNVRLPLVLLALCCLFIQAVSYSQPLPRNPDAANILLKGLVKEAERRKQQRYALIRSGYADVMFSAVQNDAFGAVAAYLRFVGLREFFLPRKPLGYYVGRGTPVDFIKFPEGQDVYIDPWLPEARKPPSD